MTSMERAWHGASVTSDLAALTGAGTSSGLWNGPQACKWSRGLVDLT